MLASMASIQTRRLGNECFVPKEVCYRDVFGLLPLYEKLAFRAPVVVVGPKGVGKTLSVQAFAHKIGCPIVTFDCSEDVRRSQLLGSFILQGNETPFVLGPLPTALDIANETGQCILALEEMNALSPQAQKMLNPLTDWRQRIEIPEATRVFGLQKAVKEAGIKGARLWVVGTMNDSVYGGVYALNEDLKSRFRFLQVDYPDRNQERAIVKELMGKTPPILEHVLTFAAETRQGSIDYALSTRDVVQLVEDIESLGEESALRIVLGKFEDHDRETLVKRVRSIFGVDLEDGEEDE